MQGFCTEPTICKKLCKYLKEKKRERKQRIFLFAPRAKVVAEVSAHGRDGFIFSYHRFERWGNGSVQNRCKEKHIITEDYRWNGCVLFAVFVKSESQQNNSQT